MQLLAIFASAAASIGAFFSFGAGALVLWLGIEQLQTWRRVRRFRKVSAKVVEARWEERKRGERTLYVPRIVFEYTVDGKTYRSNELDDMWGDDDNATSEKGKLPHEAGATVQAYYDPHEPGKSALRLDSGGCAVTAFVAAALLLGMSGYCVYEALQPEPQPILIQGPER